MMKAKINEDQCIGDGICADTCPEVFQMGDDGLAHVIAEDVPAGAEASAKDSASACPTEAIEIAE
jgi:ferredoxin